MLYAVEEENWNGVSDVPSTSTNHVNAFLQMPSEQIFSGTYTPMDTRPRRRSIVDLLSSKLSRTAPQEKGKFVGDYIVYEGGFLDNQLYDRTNLAVMTINDRVRYTGCFIDGQRNLFGKLEVRDENGRYRTRFFGIWKDNAEWSGYFYDKKREQVAKIQNGQLLPLVDGSLPSFVTFAREFEQHEEIKIAEIEADKERLDKGMHNCNAGQTDDMVLPAHHIVL